MFFPILALAFFVGLFAYNVSARESAEVTLLRGLGAPFTTQADGRVTNQIRVKIANRSGAARAYRIALADTAGAAIGDATLIAPQARIASAIPGRV